tara:strand:+ start:968 stop:1720 length:753 start_codon:yes stop_codon:yes gene_type:complete
VNNIKIKKKRIDQILLDKGLVSSRAKAQALIMTGKVYHNKKRIEKAGQLLNQNQEVKILKDKLEWVSRGGLKLAPIIINQKIEIKNKICIDLGSSTGGFSHVLLKFGAKKIYSVDVGYGQIHEKIKQDKRVVSLERTNARYLTTKEITDKVDVIVCDTSFISIKKSISKSIEFLKKNGTIIGLIKPQFEANRKEIIKGIVKDSMVHNRVCSEIKFWFENEKNIEILQIIQSPIKGPKGNIEFFLIGVKQS